MDPSIESIESKICLLGSSGAGKTSLVHRYVSGTFNPANDVTIGASFMTKRMTIDGVKLKMQLWDTAGQERFRSMAPMYYRGVSAAIVVFDITDAQSFETMKGWVTELQNNAGLDCVIYIVANKVDMSSKRRVNSETAKEYANSISGFYFETSAKNNEGVQELFKDVALELIAKQAGTKRQKEDTKVKLDENPPPQGVCSC